MVLEYVENLSQIPVFAGIDHETIVQLTHHLPRKSFDVGDMLISQGSRSLNGYMLLEGRVEVYYTSKDEEKTTIIFHEAPWVVGQVELWEEYPCLANVEAIEPCVALEMSKKDYLGLLHSSHQVAINMVRVMSQLLWITGEDRRVKFFGRVEHLLANLICHFATMYGQREERGVVLTKPVNKSEIAEILGVARRSVIRAFDQLESEKLLYVQAQQLVIPNLIALQDKARDL